MFEVRCDGITASNVIRTVEIAVPLKGLRSFCKTLQMILI